MGKNVSIEGLTPVQPPAADAGRRPGLLTEQEIGQLEEVRFLAGVLDPVDYARPLIEIQAMLQWATNVGQNDDLIGLEDFSIAIINTRSDGQNPGFVDSGAALVAVSRKTKRYGIFDLEPPQGFSPSGYARTTAFALIDLSRPEQPKPEE